MSRESRSWAYTAARGLGLSCSHKFVLERIADRHTHEHGCFPGVDRLMWECEIESRSTMMRALARLEEVGLFVRVKTRSADGTRRYTRFVLAFEPGYQAAKAGKLEALAPPSSGTDRPCVRSASDAGDHVSDPCVRSARDDASTPTKESEKGIEKARAGAREAAPASPAPELDAALAAELGPDAVAERVAKANRENERRALQAMLARMEETGSTLVAARIREQIAALDMVDAQGEIPTDPAPEPEPEAPGEVAA